MKRFANSARWLGLGLATALFSIGGWASSLKADFAYGYAEQTISNLLISPTITATSNPTSSTTASATLNGSGPATSNPLDALQAYIGGNPAAPQNYFNRYAPGATPVSPVGNFTRGDSQIASLTGPMNSASVVSESYLNSNTPTTETGSSSVVASLVFNPTVTGALSISYNYANDAYVFTTGLGAATAHFGFDITIKDLAGAVVFDSVTPITNLTLAAPPNGGEIIRSGNESVTTASLTGGQTYNIIFSITSGTSAVVGVPEPSSLVLCGMAGISGLVVTRVRRKQA